MACTCFVNGFYIPRSHAPSFLPHSCSLHNVISSRLVERRFNPATSLRRVTPAPGAIGRNAFHWAGLVLSRGAIAARRPFVFRVSRILRRTGFGAVSRRSAVHPRRAAHLEF